MASAKSNETGRFVRSENVRILKYVFHSESSKTPRGKVYETQLAHERPLRTAEFEFSAGSSYVG